MLGYGLVLILLRPIFPVIGVTRKQTISFVLDIAWRISGEFYVPLVEPRSFCIAFDFSGFWRINIPFVAQGATLLSRYIRQNFIVLLRLRRAPNVPLQFFSRRSGLLYAIFDKTPKNSMIVGYRLVDTFVQWQTFAVVSICCGPVFTISPEFLCLSEALC